MSENNTTPGTQDAQTEAAPDPAEAMRTELRREYAGKLVQAEVKAYAAQAGIKLPEGFTAYLNPSALLGADGTPSAEAISQALAPFAVAAEPTLPHLAGAGHNRDGNRIEPRRVSLDVRKR